MKVLLAALISTSLIFAAPLASAGHRYHGHGHGYHGGYYGHGGYYRHRGHHNNNNNDEAAYLVGGLLLGGLVTNAYYRSQRTYQPAVIERTYSAPAAGQRLVRDAQGRCFTSEFDANGTEYRTATDPALCNW